jgi:radical SAM/Cys-rich protein
MHDTLPSLEPSNFPAIQRKQLEIVQVNIGLRCNLACLHCHTNSNPYRKEEMDVETIELLINYIDLHKIKILDITGGAPELHPEFRHLITRARNMGVHIIDRCNLTVLEEPEQENLDQFLAENKVEIIASLPCYTKDNVDAQRGKGVFDSSIRVLQKLNQLGYGKPDTDLVLNLVYNPLGTDLPPNQKILEQMYKKELADHFNIHFNQLFTLCNMPIKRFGSTLISKGKFHDYIKLLKDSHCDENLDNVMCRNMISIDWRGFVFDCDFNQMLGLNMQENRKNQIHLSDLLDRNIEGMPIAVRDHCYGCTAGQGSSCGGALST